MTIYKSESKAKKKIHKGHTIFLKLEDGTKIRISEDSTGSVSIFTMDEKAIVALIPTSPRTFSLRSMRTWA